MNIVVTFKTEDFQSSSLLMISDISSVCDMFKYIVKNLFYNKKITQVTISEIEDDRVITRISLKGCQKWIKEDVIQSYLVVPALFNVLSAFDFYPVQSISEEFGYDLEELEKILQG